MTAFSQPLVIMQVSFILHDKHEAEHAQIWSRLVQLTDNTADTQHVGVLRLDPPDEEELEDNKDAEAVFPSACVYYMSRDSLQASSALGISHLLACIRMRNVFPRWLTT